MPLSRTAEKYRGRARRAEARAKPPDPPPALPDPIDNPAEALAVWSVETLIVPPGHPLAGTPMLLPWYVGDFLADALAPGVTEALLSTGRKNSKTAGCAVLILGLLAGPLRRPGLRIGTCSVTKEKAGDLARACREIAEASEVPGLEFLRTPSPGMIRTPEGSTAEYLSADKSAGHASGFDYVIVDELGLMTERDRALIAGMRSSTSARGRRLIALSIRGESPMLEEMIERRDLPTCVVHLYAPTIPETGDVDITDPAIWAAGNPGLEIGIKQAEYMAAEAARVMATPSDLSSFLAFDLNLSQSPTREMIFAPSDLTACFTDTLTLHGMVSGGVTFGLRLSGVRRWDNALAMAETRTRNPCR